MGFILFCMLIHNYITFYQKPSCVKVSTPVFSLENKEIVFEKFWLKEGMIKKQSEKYRKKVRMQRKNYAMVLIILSIDSNRE